MKKKNIVKIIIKVIKKVIKKKNQDILSIKNIFKNWKEKVLLL